MIISIIQSFYLKFLQVTPDNPKQQRINKNYITTNYMNNQTRNNKKKKNNNFKNI